MAAPATTEEWLILGGAVALGAYTGGASFAALGAGGGGTLAGGAAGLSAYASVAAGNAQATALKQQAWQEKIQASEQEINRRTQLLSALAAQNVAGAAGGVRSGAGSLRNISLKDLEKSGRTNRYAAVQSHLGQARLRSGANAARLGGWTGAANSLLQFSYVPKPGGPPSPGGSPKPDVPKIASN